jgi:transposase
LDRNGPHRYASRDTGFGAAGAGRASQKSFGGDVFIVRGRNGTLIKALWHDGIGLSLYAKRLDRGRFVWPQTVDGVVALTASQMSYLLDHAC